ncbi:hypothetical protein [Lentzea nigeriaca]|uniref:hypothetical protein n=1 Tax=Lentzea nigeriaca TaxID=1128665 RepID=UPI00195C6B04|nr:hypothetical protein [Lentzea nigeriaca]MBM7860422.1 hypothetical protein [Lentzea nigeriaca]
MNTDEAIEAVVASDEAPHRGHRSVIQKVIDDLIATGEAFTADTVTAALDEDTRTLASPYLVPALFRRASQAGLIHVVGYAISNRPSRHQGVLRVWRGVLANEAAA